MTSKDIYLISDTRLSNGNFWLDLLFFAVIGIGVGLIL